MKKIIVFLTIFMVSICGSCDSVRDMLPAELTNEEVINGLKEALTIGADLASTSASKEDGFFGNSKIKIPLPEEAEMLVDAFDFFSDLGALERLALNAALSAIGAPGLSDLITDASSLERIINRAAEEAAKGAFNVFADAITGMTIADGFDILRGADNAATEYLRRTTTEPLTAAFTPVVETAINTVNLGTLWTKLAGVYNNPTLMALPFHDGNPVNPNLEDYITGKAINGLMLLIEEQEAKIRTDPAAQVTDLLKKVFGGK